MGEGNEYPPWKWRVGAKLGRTLYFGDILHGLLDSPEIARRVADAMNAASTPKVEHSLLGFEMAPRTSEASLCVECREVPVGVQGARCAKCIAWLRAIDDPNRKLAPRTGGEARRHPLREAAQKAVDAEMAYRRECYPGLSGSRRSDLDATRGYYLDLLDAALRSEADQLPTIAQWEDFKAQFDLAKELLRNRGSAEASPVGCKYKLAAVGHGADDGEGGDKGHDDDCPIERYLNDGAREPARPCGDHPHGVSPLGDPRRAGLREGST